MIRNNLTDHSKRNYWLAASFQGFLCVPTSTTPFGLRFPSVLVCFCSHLVTSASPGRPETEKQCVTVRGSTSNPLKGPSLSFSFSNSLVHLRGGFDKTLVLRKDVDNTLCTHCACKSLITQRHSSGSNSSLTVNRLFTYILSLLVTCLSS